MPSNDEGIISGIFDRINRNVAKLTAQKLRHAKLDGLFIKTAENLAEWVAETLPRSLSGIRSLQPRINNLQTGDGSQVVDSCFEGANSRQAPRHFPRFAQQSRQQMKDVEFAGLLLLLLEEGPKGYSQGALDQAFTDRDDDWEHRQRVETDFRQAIGTIVEILAQAPNEGVLENSRLRNQADFYSLFGAIAENHRNNCLADSAEAVQRLLDFVQRVDDEAAREADPKLQEYYEAARSASNDRGPREARIRIVSHILAVAAA